MDHFLHPWHYAPILMALPFLPMAWSWVKSKLRKDTAEDEQVHPE